MWVGGREANPAADTNGTIWQWDLSGTTISQDLWHPGEPDGGNNHDHVYIYKGYEGLCDWTESASYGGLCKTSISTLVC